MAEGSCVFVFASGARVLGREDVRQRDSERKSRLAYRTHGTKSQTDSWCNNTNDNRVEIGGIAGEFVYTTIIWAH